MRGLTILAVGALLCAAPALAQNPPGTISGPNQPPKVFGPAHVTEPWESFTVTEAVPGSDIPVDITLLETVDGLYTPIGIRHPKGKGPFPVVLFFSGNGGAGVQQVRDYIDNHGYTLERFLKEGYAVAWLQYRAEAWYAYTKPDYAPLKVGKQQANQLMSRPPLEIDDMFAIVEYVKRLPYIDPARVGLCGNSHAGGIILRSLADGLKINSAIISEPDASEFLQLRVDAFSGDNPYYPTIESVAPYLDKKIAMERINRISNTPLFFVNRDHDELQGLFETAYTWVKEAGKTPVEHVTYDHPVHGYIVRVPRDEKGNYKPDDIQVKVIQQAIDFFKKNMGSQSTR